MDINNDVEDSFEIVIFAADVGKDSVMFVVVVEEFDVEVVVLNIKVVVDIGAVVVLKVFAFVVSV